MILLYEVAKAGPYMTVYRDSDDPRLFYYIPAFAEVRRFSDGRLAFGATLFRRDRHNPTDGFSLYNIGMVGVVPSTALAHTREQLERQYGGDITINPIPALGVSLLPITVGIYRSIRCQTQGGNIFTDLACSFTVDESLEPDMSLLFQTGLGWQGSINYTVRTRKTTFTWEVTANWHRVQSHFKAQTSVSYWFVKTNLSYEVKKLIENDSIHIETNGGTPSQKEKVHVFAEKIAARLFVRAIQPAPLPAHPTGAAVCLSINYSRVEEDRTSKWSGSENDFEERDLGMAAYIRDIPSGYFRNFDNPLVPDYDNVADTHALSGYATAEEVGLKGENQSADTLTK